MSEKKPASYSKAQLAQRYGFSGDYLAEQLNVIYFDDLEAVGYRKSMILLPPKVLRKFVELYGDPLDGPLF